MEQKNQPRSFLTTDVEHALKNKVLACLRDPAPGGILLRCLDLVAREEGGAACKIILELLMHRDFTNQEATACWHGIVGHHRDMSASLGRDVNLSVAVCDYFSLRDKENSVAKLVDVHKFEAMHQERQFDFLTGLFNKQALKSAFAKELRRAERYGRKFSLLFVDLDSFKKINDIHGHLAGDKILQTVGKVLAETKRSVDIAARFGGDEFVLLLPDTDKQKALGLAERIRNEISKQAIAVDNRKVVLTVSAGLSTYPDDGRTCNEMFRCADIALYRAKHQGRNIVRAYGTKQNRGKKRLEGLGHRPMTDVILDSFFPEPGQDGGPRQPGTRTSDRDPETFFQTSIMRRLIAP